MAYDSFPWDGTTIGHALSTDVWPAPYSSAEYADVYSKVFQSNAAAGYVIPDYNSSLGVAIGGGMNVLIGAGAMTLRGRIFENTAAVTLSIATADATNPRLDRVVVRINLASTTQTMELAVLTGTPAATPSLPLLTQTSTTYEIAVAYVWVGAAVASIAATEIHDERVFAPNFSQLVAASLSQPNLVVNSEFMAFSRLNTVLVASAGAPDNWTVVGTVTSWASVTRPSQMSRGRGVQVTAGGASAGFSQAIPVKASTVYTIKGLINVTAGDVGNITVTTNSASPNTVSKNIRRTGNWIEIIIYYLTESDASSMTLQLTALNNTDIVSFGQFLITEGRLPGPYREIRETIIFDYFIGDLNWDGDAKSTGTTTLDLDTSFQSLILDGVRAIYASTIANDSGSAANSTSLQLSANPYSGFPTVENTLTGIPNDNIRSVNGFVPLNPSNQFDIRVVASGAGTLDAQVRIFGIVI